MKRCPKCSRTFPDESQKFCTVDGGLLISDPVFDPNVTIRATAADMAHLSSPRTLLPPAANFPISMRQLQPWRMRQPWLFPATPDRREQPPFDMPPPPGISTLPGATTNPPQAKKKSKLPLILGAVALVLLLGAVGLAGVFFYVIKPRLDGVIVRSARHPTGGRT